MKRNKRKQGRSALETIILLCIFIILLPMVVGSLAMVGCTAITVGGVVAGSAVIEAAERARLNAPLGPEGDNPWWGEIRDAHVWLDENPHADRGESYEDEVWMLEQREYATAHNGVLLRENRRRFWNLMRDFGVELHKDYEVEDHDESQSSVEVQSDQERMRILQAENLIRMTRLQYEGWRHRSFTPVEDMVALRKLMTDTAKAVGVHNLSNATQQYLRSL